MAPSTIPAGIVLKLMLFGHCPAFHALINGHDALLELDTGSFELRLSPAYVQQNKIDTRVVSFKLGDQPAQSFKPVIESIEEPSQPTMADRYAQKADGIVGLDVIRQYAIGIDTINRQIEFWPHGKLGCDVAKKWTEIPSSSNPSALAKLDLTTRNPEDWFRVQAKVNGRPLNLIFDTGTAISSVNPSQVPKLALRKIAETEVEEIGKTEMLPVMAAQALSFGPLSADFPILNVETQEDPDSDGILGINSLGEGKFIIDMPDLKLYLRQDQSGVYKNPFEQKLRLAGLDVFPNSQNRLLVLVKPGSAAEKAGIRSGDAVIYFADVNVKSLNAPAGQPDQQTFNNAVEKVGMALLKNDFSITVEKPDGSHIILGLPSTPPTKERSKRGN